MNLTKAGKHLHVCQAHRVYAVLQSSLTTLVSLTSDRTFKGIIKEIKIIILVEVLSRYAVFGAINLLPESKQQEIENQVCVAQTRKHNKGTRKTKV